MENGKPGSFLRVGDGAVGFGVEDGRDSQRSSASPRTQCSSPLEEEKDT